MKKIAISDSIPQKFLKSITLTLAIFLIGCSDRSKISTDPPLQIFAAASLSSVMPDISKAFREKYPQADIAYNFAASSILARQIEQGAPGDIFLSANAQWADYLLQKNLLDPQTLHHLLGNELVLIAPAKAKSPPQSLNDLLSAAVGSIALGDWQHVPAGIYAQQALQQLGIWEKIKPKCLPALDARAALAYVANRNVDCGIVYRSDAAISSEVHIVATLPPSSQPDIRYPIALTNHSNNPLAKPFWVFLQSERALKIFESHGFKRYPAPPATLPVRPN